MNSCGNVLYHTHTHMHIHTLLLHMLHIYHLVYIIIINKQHFTCATVFHDQQVVSAH